MPKILGIILCMCFIWSETCYAIQFSQPLKIGTIDFKQGGGVSISGAASNSVQFFPGFRRRYVKDDTFGDEKGIAHFGEGTDDLYLYYNTEKCLNIGGNALNNTISEDIWDSDIYQIQYSKTSSVYPIYDMKHNHIGNETRFETRSVYSIYNMKADYIIIGREINSFSRQFVKYIDTKEITKRYFGENTHVIYKNLSTQGDTIIIDYYSSGTKGKFYFKWDDKAQWFSVKQVIN